MQAKHHRLTASTVRTSQPRPGISAPTLIADGGGLYLQITPAGVKSWIFRYSRLRKSHSMGLGPLRSVSLEDARKRSREMRVLLDRGIDPLAQKRSTIPSLVSGGTSPSLPPVVARVGTSFSECAEQYLSQLDGAHRNEKHADQWRRTLRQYAYPILGHLDVERIGTVDVLRVIEPLFARIPETARRTRGRIEKVLAWCIVRGIRSNQENPARWRAHLSEAIPAAKRKLASKHHKALPYSEMPAFMAGIREDGSDGSLLLQFIILTMCRTGEARGAKWSELDSELTLWTIPAERMKGHVTHRVPITDAVRRILQHQRRNNDLLAVRSTFVFPGRKPGSPLSDAAALGFLKRIGRTDATPHGMRATARSYAAACTDFPREICEQALSHRLRDKVEAAYMRSDYLDKRRALMQAWENYCLSAPASQQAGSSANVRQDAPVR
jgi:integrase